MRHAPQTFSLGALACRGDAACSARVYSGRLVRLDAACLSRRLNVRSGRWRGLFSAAQSAEFASEADDSNGTVEHVAFNSAPNVYSIVETYSCLLRDERQPFAFSTIRVVRKCHRPIPAQCTPMAALPTLRMLDESSVRRIRKKPQRTLHVCAYTM